jgi:hypothetical protein
MVFFDPRKWNPVERRLLLGGLVGSISYWSEEAAEAYIPQMPPELKSRLEEHLPANGELLISIAPPAALYLVGKVSKSTATKEKLSDLTLGSALYCLPHIMKLTGCQAAYVEGGKARPAARFTQPTATSKYGLTATNSNARATTTTVTPTRGLSKYVLTA